jgi:hypothetical protein
VPQPNGTITNQRQPISLPWLRLSSLREKYRRRLLECSSENAICAQNLGIIEVVFVAGSGRQNHIQLREAFS